jgi:hypothetical protein
VTELAKVIPGRWGEMPPSGWRALRSDPIDWRTVAVHLTASVLHDDMGGMIETRSRCGIRRPHDDWVQPAMDWAGERCRRCRSLTDPFYEPDD